MRCTSYFALAGLGWYVVIAVSWAVIESANGLPPLVAIARAAYFVLIPAAVACGVVWLVHNTHIGVQWAAGAVSCIGSSILAAWIWDTVKHLGAFGYSGYAWVIFGLPVVAVAIFISAVAYVHKTYR